MPPPARRALASRASRWSGSALAALLAGLAVTAAATWGFARSVHDVDEQRFRQAVQSARESIEGRLAAYQGVLLATRGLFSADSDVTAAEFRAFTRELRLAERHPGIQGIGFSLRLGPAERESVERRLRDQGLPGFRVWPADPRAELHTIAFLEPLDRRNQAALGYDMFSEAVRREAMSRARDTGAPAASGRVTLVQEIDEAKQAGFLIYLPVYRGQPPPSTVEERRARLLGFVYAPFRMDDLFAGIFGRDGATLLRVEAFDGAPAEAALLHRSAGLDREREAPFAQDEWLEVAGRRWQLTFRSSPAFEAASSRRLVPLVAATGVLLSGLVALVASSRRRAQEELRLQARVLESMGEGVSVSDERGIILYTNPAEDRMFGYAPGELLGRHVTVQNTYPYEENQRIVNEVIAELRRSGRWFGEFSNVRKDGTRFVTVAHITALEVAGRHYWVCVQEDVTDRKRAEEERSQLLERERAARAEAEAASRAKDEFLAMLGHELRNPLAPIVTALRLLRLREGEGPVRELEVIERQVQHLVRLVDDLLDVSRITRGKIRLDRAVVPVSRVVAKAIEMASPLLEERAHRLVLDVAPDLYVDGDEVRLAQVMANLLTNAAKFTDPGGRIELSAARRDGWAELRVRDDGAGIAPEALPRLFEPFTQAPRADGSATGGLGIGLTLVRSLAEAHGGSVAAASAGLGHGSEFVVRLPASEAPGAAAAPPPRGRRRTARPRRVLVVDDNHDAADALRDLLRVVGHEVEVAYDGPEALAVAARFRPEVAVLDVGLPVMSGYELAKRLRERGDDVRLLAVTGYGQEHDRESARQAGFERHFVKPVEPGELFAAIERAGERDTAA